MKQENAHRDPERGHGNDLPPTPPTTHPTGYRNAQGEKLRRAHTLFSEEHGKNGR